MRHVAMKARVKIHPHPLLCLAPGAWLPMRRKMMEAIWGQVTWIQICLVDNTIPIYYISRLVLGHLNCVFPRIIFRRYRH